MANRIALIDLDGTLADYDGAMNAALTKMRSPHEPEYMGDRDEFPWMEARRRAVALRPGFWRELAPLPAGFDVYRLLLLMGFELHILTKGPTTKPAAWMEKREWCAVHVPEAAVTITEDKSLLYGRVLVDDWPAYAAPWLAARPRGLVVMPAQPWNEGFEHPRVFRYDGTNLERLAVVLTAARDRKEGAPLVF